MKRVLFALIAAAALLLTAQPAHAAPAPAPAFNGYLVNNSTGDCLARNYWHNRIEMTPCVGDPTELWHQTDTVTSPKGTYFHLANELGACLGTTWSRGLWGYDCAQTATTDDGTTVPDPGLQWYRDQVGVGLVQIRNRKTDEVLGLSPINPGRPNLAPASAGDPTQVWKMVSKGSK